VATPNGVPNRRVVKRHPGIAKDLKELGKRYPSVERDLLYAERLLQAGQALTQTYSYQGFGQCKLYKTRVVNTANASGKSKATASFTKRLCRKTTRDSCWSCSMTISHIRQRRTSERKYGRASCHES